MASRTGSALDVYKRQHLHNLHGCYLNLPMLFHALQQMHKPVLWTLHDCWPFTGHCASVSYTHLAGVE